MSDEAARQKAEEGRVEAEVERVEHEVERRVAEGGEQAVVEQGRIEAEIERESTSATRVAAERGRVEAEGRREVSESDRVLAEEKRGSLRAFYAKLGTFVALPIAFIALLPALVGIYLVNNQAADIRNFAKKTNEIAEENCFNIEINRHYYDSLSRSLTRIAETFPPGDELSFLLQEIASQARLTRDAMITTKCKEIQG